MASRAFGELLLRPSTFTRIAPPTRFAPTWTAQRCITDSASKPAAQPARQEAPKTATTPEVAARSPQDANAAIDNLFSGDASTNNTPQESLIDRAFGSNFSKPTGRGRPARRPNMDVGAMNMDGLIAPTYQNKPTSTVNLANQQAETFANYPRLNPTYGRSVDLDASRGRDIVRGIGMLGSLMARNKVKSDFNKQRFHERGGLKRKRLNSERWRARFKQGFRDVTGRVMELTRKGW